MKHSILIGNQEPFGTVLVDVIDEFTLRNIRWFIHLSHVIPEGHQHYEYICSEWGTGMKVNVNNKHYFPISTSLEKFKKTCHAYIGLKNDAEIIKAMNYAHGLIRKYREPDPLIFML